jgi:hypothetical protein
MVLRVSMQEDELYKLRKEEARRIEYADDIPITTTNTAVTASDTVIAATVNQLIYNTTRYHNQLLIKLLNKKYHI